MAGTRRALVTATAAYVLGWTAHTTFVFYLAPVALRLGGVTGRDAWVFAGTAVASILVALPAGWAADRFPRRRALRAALLLLALSYVPLLAAPTLASVLCATALTGAGLSLLFVAFNAYVADLLAGRAAVGGATMPRAYGASSAAAVLAGAAGPFLAAGVFTLLEHEATAMRVNAALFLAGAAVGFVLTFSLPSSRAALESGPASRASFLDTWRSERRNVGPVAVLFVLLGAGYGMTQPYFAVYFLDHVGVSKQTWGVVLGLGTLASAAGSFAAGRLAGTWRPTVLVLGPQLALAFATLAFLAPWPALWLSAAFVARNLVSTTVAPTVSSVLMERVAPRARGRAQSVSNLAWNVGWAGGAAVGGVLLARLAGGLFPLGAVVGLAGATAGMLLLARR